MRKNKGLLSFLAFVMVLAFASLSCGVSDIQNLFATETPTATNTFTPSPTLTSTSTPTPTITPSPTSTPIPTGRHVEQLPNDNFLFIDYDLGYEIAFPADWLVVPMQSDEQAAAMEKITALDSSFSAMEDAMLGLPGVMAVKPTEGDNADLDALAIGISFEGENFAAISLQEAIDGQELPAGAELLFKDVITNASGTDMGIFETDDGETHTITTIFKTDKGMVVLSITSPTARYDAQAQELVDLLGTVKIRD